MKHKNLVFQVVYLFENKETPRYYRTDCMSRKINSSFLNFIKCNRVRLDINYQFIKAFQKNLNFTSRKRYQEFALKFNNFALIYEEYLTSNHYQEMINANKTSYKDSYFKLFYKHTKNFIDYQLFNSLNKKNGLKNKKLRG